MIKIYFLIHGPVPYKLHSIEKCALEIFMKFFVNVDTLISLNLFLDHIKKIWCSVIDKSSQSFMKENKN